MDFKTVFDLAADWSWMDEYYGFKIKGGRVVYTDAIFNSNKNGSNTYIGYIKPSRNKVKQIGRYVPNSTEIELVSDTTKMSKE